MDSVRPLLRLTLSFVRSRVEQGWKGAARTIDAKFGRGILATKSVLDTTGNIWAVPAPLLALLLQ
jgi:hypothetical protein